MVSKERFIIIDPCESGNFNLRYVFCPKGRLGRMVLPVAGPTFNLPYDTVRKKADELRDALAKNGVEVEIFEGSLTEGLELIKNRLEA